MSFTPLNHDFYHVRNLPDVPRLSDGYTPALLKETFDRAGEIIRDYLNGTLLPALEATMTGKSGAESLGSAAIGDIPEGTLHTQLSLIKAATDTIKQELRDAAAGLFPPESISESLLTQELLAAILEGQNKALHLAAFTSPGEYSFTAERSGLYRLRMCGGGAAGTYYHPFLLQNDRIEGSESFRGKGGGAAAALESFLPLSAGDTLQITVGAGGEVPEIAETPAEALREGYDIADIQAHLRSDAWNVCGGDSLIQSADGHLLFSCEGGNSAKTRVYATADAAFDKTLLHAGKGTLLTPIEPTYEDVTCMLGASSALGQGGEYRTEEARSVLPGFGGGGHGGLLYLTTPHFDPEHAPSCGGHGAVFLEYVR